MGSNGADKNTVIDLGAEFLWFACDNYTLNSYSPVPCDSSKCELAKGIRCTHSDPCPDCNNNTRGSTNSNPFKEFISGQGYYEDTLYTKDSVRVPQFIFSCSSNDYLIGLASDTISMLGLARIQIYLHKQLTGKLNLPDKFSICLPSSGLGKLSIGDVFSSNKSDMYPLLNSKPLIKNPNSMSRVYSVGEVLVKDFIDVKTISVDGKTLSLKNSYFAFDKDGNSGTASKD